MIPIRVMSRADLAEPEPFDRPVALVSIRSPGGPVVEIPPSSYVRDVLRLEFDDVDDPKVGVVMTDEQARRILEFVRPHVGTDVQVVCQCEAGVSRSAGVAVALSRIHFGHDGGFYRTHRPNPWVRRRLLRAARGGATKASGAASEAGDSALETKTSEVCLMPTTLPTAVLVREGRTWEWAPRSPRSYPAGTLGGDGRTLSAHVFVPLEDRTRRVRTAREIGTWARRTLHAEEATRDALVITRAGTWREKRSGTGPATAGEAAVEVYVQTSGGLTRDEWTRALRAFADAIGEHFEQDRFDVVLTEDGLMYKRAVWRPHVDDVPE
jgi:hypothetical protein